MQTLHKAKLRWQVPAAVILLLFNLVPSGWSQGSNDSRKRSIDVASVNLYVGSDFSPVLLLDPSDPNYGAKLLSGVATIYGRILDSDFHTRADALARQIVARAPDLVALQEVTLIQRQSPGDLIVGGQVPATEPHLDYLAILMEALHRYGGHYEVVSQVEDTVVEVPLFTGSSFDDLRLTDRDVILARQDLPPGHLRTSNPQHGNFEAKIPLPNGVTVLRGWCSIDVQVRGRQFRVISTHLEDRVPPNVQFGQALELLAKPAATTLPVILAGDFNTDAFANYSPETYLLLTNQGKFSDLWQAAGGKSRGLTWGHDEFLSDFTVPFVLRLDLILFRGNNLEATAATVVDPVIGTVPPLWFSDHAAVFGTLGIK